MSKIIGLTGGIASGKSTITAYLRQGGYQVIDADELVHQLQKKGGVLYQALLLTFGTQILGADGQLDRPKLAELIFSSQENQEKSAKLQNRIIREALAEQRDRLAETQAVFFMDIPLLFELDFDDWFDEIWLVVVDEETQLERLMARNQLTREQAFQRLRAQMPLADKKKRADRLIDNSGSLKQTYAQLQQLLAEI